MYTIRWNEFLNMDRGGSIPRTVSRVSLKGAKEYALVKSRDPMVPGLVTVWDSQGKQKVAYQQGKLNTPLFK